MNQNIRFSTKSQEVSIFKFELTRDFPFEYSLSHTVTATNDLGTQQEPRNVYEVDIDGNTIDVCVGDYLVFVEKTGYLNGVNKVYMDVEVHTPMSLLKNFEAYDELEEEYLDEILDAFIPQVPDEPTDEDIALIEDGKLDILMQEATNLTFDDLLEEDEY